MLVRYPATDDGTGAKNSLANHPSGAFGGATTGRYERPKSDVA
jgi:hypothetical protein